MRSNFECASSRIDLAQNGALTEEQWLLTVNDDVVEVVSPFSTSSGGGSGILAVSALLLLTWNQDETG